MPGLVDAPVVQRVVVGQIQAVSWATSRRNLVIRAVASCAAEGVQSGFGSDIRFTPNDNSPDGEVEAVEHTIQVAV